MSALTTPSRRPPDPPWLTPELARTLDEIEITGELPEGIAFAEAWEISTRIDAWRCEHSLAHFVRQAWQVIEPGRQLVWNWHLDTVCAYLEAFRRRDISRLIINIPPRCMKSLIVSVFYPVWVWTTSPEHQFLSLSHEQGLALRDSLKARVIIESDWFRERWPTLRLSGDQNEKAYYSNQANGHRNARGILSGMTGRGGDTLMIDDPHDAEKAQSDVERQNVIDAYDNKLTSRLNDQTTGGIVLIMQRLHELDLAGHVQTKTTQDWTVLSIPMEYDGPRFNAGKDIGRPDLNDPRKTPGELLWPRRFPRKAVESLRVDLGSYGYSGQMQQLPSPKGGGILKKHWWKPWPKSKSLPVCDHIFLSWDTAFSESDHEKAAYSAMTEWGIFWQEQSDRYDLIVLSAWHDRVDYPDLRAKAKELQREVQPDRQLIEKKASGQSLIQDLRRAKISIYPYMPDRDKIARAYAVQPMLEAGQVWYPEGAKWAESLINYTASFPNGAPPSADYTDTCTQAWLYLRNGWWISGHPSDIDEEEEVEEQPPRPRFIR